MTTKQQHTPTPWKMSMGYIEDANGNDVFHKSELFVAQRTVKEVQEISAFIVKAVNNHDALVEALIKAGEIISVYARPENSPFYVIGTSEALEAIQTALAQVEKG